MPPTPMHLSSLINMQKFRDNYLAGRDKEPLDILDIGSTDIFGCYRPIFHEHAWRYTGVDLTPGPNVNVVLQHPYHWREIAAASQDVVISGQVLEHVEFFWITVLEISRVLRPGGLACLIAPSAGYEHRYPVDCWRFYPDGMRALARFARLECLDVRTDWEGSSDPDSNPWRDTTVILRKPRRAPHKALAVRLMQAAQRQLMSWRLV